MSQFGAGVTQSLSCPKSIVGRVIGRGGETIKMLQRQHQVNIQIEQAGDPTTVQATGPAANVAEALKHIKDIISGNDRGEGGFGGSGYGAGTVPVSRAPMML